MSSLSKKVLISGLITFFFTFTAFGFENIVVETGGEHSASRAFTLELGKNWNAKYSDSSFMLKPDHKGDFSTRFESLNKGFSRWVIAPVSYLTPEEMEASQVKLVSVLWEFYIAPLSDRASIELVEKNKFQYWLGRMDSLLIRRLMKGVKTVPFGSSESDVTESSEIETGEVVVDENGMIVEPLPAVEGEADKRPVNDEASEMTPLEAKTMDQLIQVEPEQMPLVPGLYSDFVLFYDMVGSVRNLYEDQEPPLNVLSLGEGITQTFIETVPWLSPMKINVPGQSAVHTVGGQMGIFCKADEDPEMVKQILDLLKQPLISSYIMKKVQSRETSKIADAILHAESIRYFK